MEEATARSLERASKRGLPQIAGCGKWKNTISQDREGRENVKDFIVICFDALDTFGKSSDQLANVVKLFLITLADYPAPLVKNAFEKWVKTQSKMPTPAEIINIIEEDNQKILDFINHKRNGGMLADFAVNYIQSKLGKGWKNYV